MGLYLVLAVLGMLVLSCSGAIPELRKEAVAAAAVERPVSDQEVRLANCELGGKDIPTPLCFPIGSVVPWMSSHPCEICICTGEYSIGCFWIDCAYPNCHWWQWYTPPGACCPVCRPQPWVELEVARSGSGPEEPKDLQCEVDTGAVGQPGGVKTNVECFPPNSWAPSNHPCKTCYCDGIKIKCDWIDCAPPKCRPEYQFVPQGGCCPRCRYMVAYPVQAELSSIVVGK